MKTNIKIWIDGYEANVPQRLGSGQVAYEVIKNIEKLDTKNDYTILLPTLPREDMPKEREGFRYKIVRPNKLWTRIALPLALYTTKDKPDVFYTPTHYIPRFSPVKRVAHIFDLAYLRFDNMFKKKDLYQLTNWTKYSIKNADHIITISNFTKKDIIKQYGIQKEKITVAYPGYNSNIFVPIRDQEKINKVKSKYNIDGKYIIFIGTIQPRKNIAKLIDAFKNIEGLKLVIVGKTTGQGRQGWMFEEILEKPRQLKIEDKVIFTGFVPDEDLPALVNGAVAYVLPSLWEGFGIPVVDAMACGIPVIVSNVSSLPEITGKAGLLVSPQSENQIEQAIRTISTDTKLRQKLSRECLKQASKFSWKKTAQQVIKVLEEVGNEK